MTCHQLIEDSWKIKWLIIVRKGYLTFRSHISLPVFSTVEANMIRIVFSWSLLETSIAVRVCITDLLLPAVIFKCGIKIMTLHVLFLFCYLMHTSHPGELSTVEQLVRGFLRFSLDCILLSPRSLIFLTPPWESSIRFRSCSSFFSVYSERQKYKLCQKLYSGIRKKNWSVPVQWCSRYHRLPWIFEVGNNCGKSVVFYLLMVNIGWTPWYWNFVCGGQSST